MQLCNTNTHYITPSNRCYTITSAKSLIKTFIQTISRHFAQDPVISFMSCKILYLVSLINPPLTSFLEHTRNLQWKIH